MDKDHPMTPQTHKDTNRVKIISSVLLSVILFIAEMFFMTSESKNYIIIGIIAVLMLLSICFLAISLLSESQRKAIRREEQYNNIFKSEKATYVRLRKSFEDLESRIAKLENIMDEPKDEIIATQKSLAKVTINRTKENTDAVLNSNDKLIDKMFDLETQINDSNSLILENEKKLLEATNKELLQRQQEMMDIIKSLELSLKKVESSYAGNASIQMPVDIANENVPEEEPEIGETIGQFSFEQEDVAEEAIEEPVSELGFEEVTEEEPEIGETIGQFSFEQEDVAEEAIEEPVSELGFEEVTEEEPEIGETIGQFSFEQEDVTEETEEELVSELGFEEVEEEPVSELGFEEEVEEEPVSELGFEEVEEEPVSELGFEEEVEEEPVSELGFEEVEEEPVSELGFEEEVEEEPVSELGFEEVEEEPVSELGFEEVAEEEPASELGFEEVVTEEPDELGFDQVAAIADDVLNDAELITEEEKMAMEEEKLLVQEEEPEEKPEQTESTNKIMSPDEIAALIANTTASSAPVIEEPAPVEKVAPNIDSLSDPNKIMSADEIAALISSI